MDSVPAISTSPEAVRANSVSGYGTASRTAAPTLDSAGQQQINYLNLLITQLRNQNPLEPMDNNQMAMQLAQLSQLQELETMNGSFKDLLTATQAKYAASLIGKNVMFMPEGEQTALMGQVGGIEMVDGEPRLCIGNYSVPVGNILGISNTAQNTPTA